MGVSGGRGMFASPFLESEILWVWGSNLTGMLACSPMQKAEEPKNGWNDEFYWLKWKPEHKPPYDDWWLIGRAWTCWEVCDYMIPGRAEAYSSDFFETAVWVGDNFNDRR